MDDVDKSASIHDDTFPRRSTYSLGVRGKNATAVFLALLLCACRAPVPPIAQGLPRSFGPTPEFNARIKQRFPIGAAESPLIAELRAEHFDIAEIHDSGTLYKYKATNDVQDFPCRETWTVIWVAENGKLTGIEGRTTGQLCL